MVDAPPELIRPPRGDPQARRRRARYRLRPLVAATCLLLAVVLGLTAVSITRALVAPGTDSVSARLAEWGRTHHQGWLINQAERLQYKAHPPKIGGNAPAIPRASALSSPGTVAGVRLQHLPPPPQVAPFARPALPGEGAWQVLATTDGIPAIRAAFVRPDGTHTSYLTGVAWLDPKLIRFELHPGTMEPGQPAGSEWHSSNFIAPSQRTGLLALFNSGFRMRDARGGYYAEGKTVGTLRPGAAALVISKHGSATVGQWGRDVRLGPDVASVRQNLDLIVDHGQAAPGLAVNDHGRWGFTLGNRLYVWRSAVGVTADGAILYAAGNALSAPSLANLMVRAGALRAMELDINPEWTTFAYLKPGSEGPVPTTLTPDEQRSPHRWFTTSSRDFVAVYGRS